MNILNFILGRKNDVESCFLRDLCAIAVNRNGIDNDVYDIVKDILKTRKIDERKFEKILAMSPNKIMNCYPENEEERHKYLFDLVYLMVRGCIFSRKKFTYIMIVAGKLGYGQREVHEIIETLNDSPFK